MFWKNIKYKKISLKVPVLDNLAFGKNKTQFCVKYKKLLCWFILSL